MSKNSSDIILGPHLTEKTVRLGEQGKFVFWVHPDANKIEIAKAIEDIYNAGKKKDKDKISVLKVNVINQRGKLKRVNWKSKGYRANRRKAIITLEPGQLLEGFGV